MSEIADKAIDLAADAVGEVADQAESAEQVIRSLKGIKLSYAALGAVVGAAAGALVTWKIGYKRIQKQADEYIATEVDAMRHHYYNKEVALENTLAKPQLEDLVREKGYSSPDAEDNRKPPMAVTPPTAVMEAAEAAREEEAPVAIARGEVVEAEERNVFRDRDQFQDTWDYDREVRGRSPVTPYIIHTDERGEMDYDITTLTYYEGDDVLCREDDSVIGEGERDQVVGEGNMTRFGHGSGDPSIVYVRNDQLELVFEIVRSPNSYAEEVHGLKHSDGPRRRERHVYDDE
jgi:hypothetical protein